MNEGDLPKLSLLQLSVYIADLLLVTEGSAEAVKETKVRVVWHLFFFSLIGVVLGQKIFILPFESWMENSSALTATWRCFQVASSFWLLLLLFFLTYRHYRYLLLTSKDLKFRNVGFFFVMGIMLFGLLYGHLYTISPDLFHHADPIIVPKATRTPLPFLKSIQFTYDFHLYSACTSISLDYPRITSASAIVSLINFVEVLSCLVLAALLVATFVEKSSQT